MNGEVTPNRLKGGAPEAAPRVNANVRPWKGWSIALALTVLIAPPMVRAQSAAPAPTATAATPSAQAPMSPTTPIAPTTPSPAVSSELAKGEYLARAGDCGACHTVKGGLPYAGGLALNSPLGAIYSTNITPDAEHGIGSYSYDDFAKALRNGVAKGGRRLYPAMPFPSFSKIDDEDMHALYIYFMQGVKPAGTANVANGLKFPFNVRSLMIGWDVLFRPDGVFKANPQQTAEWNRGAYLVQGLGHCGACHTPHSITQQEKAFDATDNSIYLAGNNLDGWHAGNLRSDVGAGLGRWTVEELMSFFKTGRNVHTAAFGAMTQAVGDSTQYLTDADLKAMAIYLKSLPPKQVASTTVATPGASDPASGLSQGQLATRGAEVYLNNCNACHRSSGRGAEKVFPQLAGNSAVLSEDPTSLIHVVLAGSKMPSTATAPAPLGMPGFGWRLPDQQVADVLTFVRSAWGNQAAAVTTEQVAKVRRETSKP